MIIENIIITSQEGDFDFQAEGFEPEIIEVFEDGIEYINPMTGKEESHDCDFSAGAAIINL